MATHRFTIEGTEFEVQVGPRSGSIVRVDVNGRAYDVHIADAAPATAASAPVARTAAAAAPLPVASRGGEYRAPISGVVLRIEVTPGQKVTRGTVLLILEAMKMENEIFAATDGIVKSVDVKPQQEVREGDLLLVTAAG